MKAFEDAGGWIMVAGLQPDAIGEYDRFVGADHVIRPFRMERVTLEDPEFPLAATLGNRDLALYTPTILQHGKYWISPNTYSYVIDGIDAAPFTQPPGARTTSCSTRRRKTTRTPTTSSTACCAATTGATSARSGSRRPAPIRSCSTSTGRTPSPPCASGTTTPTGPSRSIDVIVDGDQAGAYHMTLPDSDAMTELKFPQPVQVKKSITLQIRSWRVHRNPEQRLVGIDYVQFLRPKAPGDAVVIDNVGGLVAFPHGNGGIFLNQVKFMADEPKKANVAQKVSVMGMVLENMGVGFARGQRGAAGRQPPLHSGRDDRQLHAVPRRTDRAKSAGSARADATCRT